MERTGPILATEICVSRLSDHRHLVDRRAFTGTAPWAIAHIEHDATLKAILSSSKTSWTKSIFLCLCCRMMYWSVIGDHSHLEESAMDGSLRRVILEKNLRRPTGQYFNMVSHGWNVDQTYCWIWNSFELSGLNLCGLCIGNFWGSEMIQRTWESPKSRMFSPLFTVSAQKHSQLSAETYSSTCSIGNKDKVNLKQVLGRHLCQLWHHKGMISTTDSVY